MLGQTLGILCGRRHFDAGKRDLQRERNAEELAAQSGHGGVADAEMHKLAVLRSAAAHDCEALAIDSLFSRGQRKHWRNEAARSRKPEKKAEAHKLPGVLPELNPWSRLMTRSRLWNWKAVFLLPYAKAKTTQTGPL